MSLAQPYQQGAPWRRPAPTPWRLPRLSRAHGANPRLHAGKPRRLCTVASASSEQGAAAGSKERASPSPTRRRSKSVPPDTDTEPEMLRLSSSSPKLRSNSPGFGTVSADMLAGEDLPIQRSPVLECPTIIVTRPLPRVLILHTGGTLGMDTSQADVERAQGGGQSSAPKGLRPAAMLANVLSVVPELRRLSNVDLQVVFNKDSSRVGPSDWIQIARILDSNRAAYDAFMIIHGTDTMAYTAAALSLMLRGFRRPVVMTGSQLPLAAPRTDARQNLLDAIQCATASFSPPHVNLQEVAICFGGRLLRGNRARKVHSSSYQAFDTPGYSHLAQLGIDVAWNERMLLRPEGAYVPRFNLEPRVMRVPIVPGVDPRDAYGDLVARGVKGIVLEVFGVGNIPDLPEFGYIPWLQEQLGKGLQVAVVSQCGEGPLQPELYSAGGLLSEHQGQFSIGPGSGMTPECAVVKLMLVLAYPSLAVGEALAGEL